MLLKSFSTTQKLTNIFPFHVQMCLHESGALGLGRLHTDSIAEEELEEEGDNHEGEEEEEEEEYLEEEDEEDVTPDGTVHIVTCDKETNTDSGFRHPRRRSDDTVRGSAIRRSQTFSPAGRPGIDYTCKVRWSFEEFCGRFERS